MSDVTALPLPELSAAAPPAHGTAAGPGAARPGAGEPAAEPFGDVLGRELRPGKDPPAGEPGIDQRGLQSGAETGKSLPAAPPQAQAPAAPPILTAVPPAAAAAPTQAAVAAGPASPAATAAATSPAVPTSQLVAERLRLLQAGASPAAPVTPDARGLAPAGGAAAAATTPTAPPGSAVPADAMLETASALRPTAESIGRLVLDQAAAAAPPPAHTPPAGAPPPIADAGALQVSAAHGPAWFGSPAGIDGAPAAQAAAATPLPVPFGQAGWDQALGQRVVWMAGNGVHEAKMQLNPPQLGPLEVRVQLHHDQASIVFTSHHAQVRDALDAALPRLREAFADSGLNLVDVNVGHQPPARHGGEGAFGQPGGQSFATTFGSGGDTDLPLLAETPLAGPRGLVDYYV